VIEKDSELANGIKVEYLDSLKFMESEGEKLRDVFTYDCKTAPKQVPLKPADPEIIRVTVERNLKGMIKFEDFFQEVNDFVDNCWGFIRNAHILTFRSKDRSSTMWRRGQKNGSLRNLPELVINFNERVNILHQAESRRQKPAVSPSFLSRTSS